MNILVTAGGTREYSDGVRYLGNTSSGRTGALLTDYLAEKGHSVMWLGAESAIRPQNAHRYACFVGYDDLADYLKKYLSEHTFDVIFHAAAVSDYQVTAVHSDGTDHDVSRNHKISSSAQTLQLTLSKHPKIINHLADWSINKDLKVIGFKLTNTENTTEQTQAVQKLLAQPGLSAVVHNDLNDISEKHHPFSLHVHGRDAFECADIKAVVNVLMTLWEMEK